MRFRGLVLALSLVVQGWVMSPLWADDGAMGSSGGQQMPVGIPLVASPSIGSVIPYPPLPVWSDTASRKAKGSDPAADLQFYDPTQFIKTEFQEFLSASLGRDLPMFGYNLFGGVPSTYAPADNVPVTSDYVLGPGDEIILTAWGQVDVNFRGVVDRTGSLFIPKVGSVNVAGIKYQNLDGELRNAIGRVFRNFNMTVSMGRLRSIQIFVVGQARRPGAYTLSSLSTLVNALFATGGPALGGSMRNIQLKRGGKVVTEFDMYDLLLKGDKSKDVPLLPGDVIFVPPVSQLVAVAGSVNVPAIYEIKGKADLAGVIALAGGLATTAEGKKVLVERIDNRKSRSVDEFLLDQAGLERNIKDGDLITVASISPRFENTVTLRGNVAYPFRYPWHAGMRVRDLVPEKETLMTNDYWVNKNMTTRLDIVSQEKSGNQDRFGTQSKSGNQDRVGNLDRFGTQSKSGNQDRLDILDRSGTQGRSGSQDRLGGLDRSGDQEKSDGQDRLRVDVKRNLSEINWDYAVVERLNPHDLTTTLIPFNLGKAILENDPINNIQLEAGDVVTVFSKDDIQVPVAMQTKYIRLEGEVQHAGLYKAEAGETLRKLLARVGGLTPNAYLYGAEFTRESTREVQQKKMDEALDRMARDFERSSTSKSQNLLAPEDASALKSSADSQHELINRLRQVKATGRIVLEIQPDSNQLKEVPDLALEDGDRFFVPPAPSTVSVIGSVYNENAFIYKPAKRLGDYLNQAGGVNRHGDKSSVYVVRADGTIFSKRQSGWLLGDFEGERMMPGDTIVVPEETDKTTLMKEIKDWTQILYQFGLGAAAFKILR
jgi:protein involved in polysaccharide export with SLBB domain